MKILVADDDELSLELLTHALQQEGHVVLQATNGTDALRIAQEQRIRIIISDIQMPGMGGIELCREIRQTQDAYVYIILLTSSEDDEAIHEGADAGADDFITKPFHKQKLLLRLRAGERILAMETRDVALFSLAKLAEYRDTDTGLHIERVQHYSRALAESLARDSAYQNQIDRELVRLIYSTSPLHDIGKVGIPDAVLHKPGKLTDEEFDLMKTHVNIGTQALDAALQHFPDARFLMVAREIAATHHEQWGGRGYPLGLSGEAIPLSGRIVSVADVYDALTTKRVYKDAFSHEKAREIILNGSGTQFDPEVIRAFSLCELEFIAIRERMSDEAQQRLNPPAPASIVPPTS